MNKPLLTAKSILEYYSKNTEYAKSLQKELQYALEETDFALLRALSCGGCSAIIAIDQSWFQHKSRSIKYYLFFKVIESLRDRGFHCDGPRGNDPSYFISW